MTRRSLITLALAVAAVLVASVAGPVHAHEGTNHGTIKVHDDESVSPAERNQPHVSCGFWIEGFNIADSSGRLVFYSWPPTGDMTEVTPDGDDLEWSGSIEADEDGYHFLSGPFELPDGHYRVEAYLDAGHPGNEEHFAKSKTFWVNGCVAEPSPPPCPLDVAAIPQPNGDVVLTWTAVDAATEYRIYRGDSADDLDSYASVTATTYTDEDTVVGETYVYAVTAVVGGEESAIGPDCIVEATAIPFFPSALVGAIAVLGGVGAVIALRRRG